MADGMMGFDPQALLKQQIQQEQERRLLEEAKLSNPQFWNLQAGRAGQAIGQALFGKSDQIIDPRLQQAAALQDIQKQALQAAGGDASSPQYFKSLATGFARMGMSEQAAKAAKQAADIEKAAKGGFGESGYTQTGYYRSKSGIVYPPTEMKARREEMTQIERSLNALNEITGEDIKQAQFPTDLTQGGISKSLAGQFDPKTLGAQTKIAASALQDVLNNLPPGSASDKDIQQAKASFPGYSDANELRKWINRTKRVLEFNLRRLQENYDFNPAVKSSGEVEFDGKSAKISPVRSGGPISKPVPGVQFKKEDVELVNKWFAGSK